MRLNTLALAIASALASEIIAVRALSNSYVNALWHKAALAHSPATSTAAAAAPTHTIAVGATGFTFMPNNLTASIGDVVEFNFYPGNHSVARSGFKFPCIPYEDTGANRVGFYSGFLNTNVYSSDGPKFRVRVNDSEPIFYYCTAPGSCLDNHMIGVINANASWTLAAQENYTANTTIQVVPGEPLPSEFKPTISSASSVTTIASVEAHHHHHRLSDGTIAGIVIGVLVGAVVMVLIAFHCCCGRLRRHRDGRSSLWLPRRHLTTMGHHNLGHSSGHGQATPLSPVSPTSVSASMGSPTTYQPPYIRDVGVGSNRSPGPGPFGHSVSPEMTDMHYAAMGGALGPLDTVTPVNGFFAHHALNASNPGANPPYALPTNNQQVGALALASPLHSHLTYPDKDHFSPQVPSLAHHLPTQLPIELPAARDIIGSRNHNASSNKSTLQTLKPVALKDSPTIGAADGAWSKSEDSSRLDLSKE